MSRERRPQLWRATCACVRYVVEAAERDRGLTDADREAIRRAAEALREVVEAALGRARP